MTDQRATHPCDGCGTYTADRVCPSCWGTTDDPMWCRLCNGVCQEGPGCSPMREDRMATEGHNTPVSTPSGPSAGLEGQDATQETQDATEAAQGRVERYEDLAVRLLELNDFRAHDRSVAARIGSAYRSLADQEHAEKDATIAELRAEVEEYRAKKFAPMSRIQRAERVAENAVADKRAAEARVAEKDATIADVLAKRNEDDVERWSGVLSEAEARVAELEATVAKAWDEGFDVATDNFVHSDYCGRTCQCQGIHGQSNPYRDAPKDTTAP